MTTHEINTKYEPSYGLGITLILIDAFYTMWWLTSIRSMYGMRYIVLEGNALLDKHYNLSSGEYIMIVFISVVFLFWGWSEREKASQ